MIVWYVILIAMDNKLLAKTIKQGDCLVWIGAKTHNGYGLVRRNNKSQLAHRVAYTQVKGAIPDGLTINHKCQVTLCINPEHLEAMTLQENIALSTKSGVIINRNKTHCIRGHEFTPDNIWYVKTKWNPRRICKQCALLNQRKYQAKLKAK